jgi:hypothetical protein
MILISRPEVSAVFETAMERLSIRFRRLLFWEQINLVVQGTDGQEVWVIDDLPLDRSHKILFAAFPIFAEPATEAHVHSHFLHAEWQSTLTTMLWDRRAFVLNGYWLVGRLWLQRNRHFFLSQLWALGWSPSRNSANVNTSTIWVLLNDWSTTTYPVGGVHIGSMTSDALLSATHYFLKENRIDALILELRIDADNIALVGTYLWPPFSAELRLVTDFLAARVRGETL